MTEENGHIGHNLAIWGVITGASVGAMLTLKATWPIWTLVLTWIVIWLIAILSLSDGPSRRFLAGTLKHSNYTQIYTALTRKSIMWVWARLGDDVDDKASIGRMFRSALTWRMLDKALLLAVVYPIILLVTQWIVSGNDAKIADLVIIEAAPIWPARASTVISILIVSVGLAFAQIAMTGENERTRIWGNWSQLIIIIPGIAIAILGGSATAAIAPIVIAASMSDDLKGNSGILYATVSGCIMLPISHGLTIIVAVAVLGLAFASFTSTYLDKLDDSGRHQNARFIAIGVVIFISLSVFVLLDWQNLHRFSQIAFIFFAVIPLINGLFDAVSYAATLALLRRGLNSRLPLIWGLCDLVLACALFLAIGTAMLFTMHAINQLTGVVVIDLAVLMADIKTNPGEFWWLYLMLFSTIAPTAFHAFSSLLGLQGIWPRPMRRPVASLIAQASNTPMKAAQAAVMLSLIWTIPIVLIGTVCWYLWTTGGFIVTGFLQWYFEQLLWVAQVPMGAL